MSFIISYNQYYRYWCYQCNMYIRTDEPITVCPVCNESFIESISLTLIRRLLSMDIILEPQQQQQPVPKDITSKLPVSKVDTIEGLNYQQCSICLENYQVGDSIKQLPCKHYFHVTCLDNWFNVGNFCPICKYRIC